MVPQGEERQNEFIVLPFGHVDQICKSIPLMPTLKALLRESGVLALSTSRHITLQEMPVFVSNLTTFYNLTRSSTLFTFTGITQIAAVCS